MSSEQLSTEAAKIRNATASDLMKKYGKDATKEQQQEIYDLLVAEAEERRITIHNAAVQNRRLATALLTKEGRRHQALLTLENELENGYKPAKGRKDFKMNEEHGIEYETVKLPDGTEIQKPIRLNIVPLNSVEIMQIEKQILSLKRKLKLN